MIEYRKGNVLQDTDEKRIIAHIVNNKGGFGKGFALQVAKKYPTVKKLYKDWYHRGILSDYVFKLGQIQPIICLEKDLIFVNMLAQNGYKSKSNPTPIDYKALEKCLESVRNVGNPSYYKEIWMPKIGTGLAGGDWNRIETIINSTLNDRKVVIFEYDKL